MATKTSMFKVRTVYKDSDGRHQATDIVVAVSEKEAYYIAENHYEVSPAARDVWDVNITVEPFVGKPRKNMQVLSKPEY